MRETEVDRHFSRLFFRKPIRIGAGERIDQSALAVVDVTSRCDYEICRFHASQLLRWRHGRTSQSNCIYHCLILWREDCPEIELKAVVSDVPDDGGNCAAQKRCELIYGTSIRDDVDCNGGDDRPWESASAYFDATAANRDLPGQTA